jgi:hypothetical protein
MSAEELAQVLDLESMSAMPSPLGDLGIA